ncbi:aspartate-semialdehyde dehydrogenase [Candidatus Entotheonella serta]|nr:aspartate-semialdehyde dehydrogenase [Candidatus Entotheonella serta]
MRPCRVALIGATGVVGGEILQLMEEREFPVQTLSLLTSAHSEGQRLSFRDRSVSARMLTKDELQDIDIAIFAADSDASRDFVQHAVESGAVVIDCSRAFRLDPEVPLCVPEINAQVIRQHTGIIAVPHSLTTQVALTLAPLHAVVPLKRVMVSAYQAVSGMGRAAMRAFDQQLRDMLNFRQPELDTFPHQLAFNCVPQCGDFLDNGYTSEETAIMDETRKLLALTELPITATAVWVPLMHSHAAAVTIETEQPLAPAVARDLLGEAPGVVVEDDVSRLFYPSPVRVNGRDEAYVGRIRSDFSVPYGLHLWVVADNLRRGVALNVVQIAEALAAA